MGSPKRRKRVLKHKTNPGEGFDIIIILTPQSREILPLIMTGCSTGHPIPIVCGYKWSGQKLQSNYDAKQDNFRS